MIRSYLLHSTRPHCMRWLCWTFHASYICLHFTNYKMRKLCSLTNTSILKLFWRIYKWMQVSLFSIVANTKHLECHECDRIWLHTFILCFFFLSPIISIMFFDITFITWQFRKTQHKEHLVKLSITSFMFWHLAYMSIKFILRKRVWIHDYFIPIHPNNIGSLGNHNIRSIFLNHLKNPS